jgi:hypothetical protein
VPAWDGIVSKALVKSLAVHLTLDILEFNPLFDSNINPGVHYD